MSQLAMPLYVKTITPCTDGDNPDSQPVSYEICDMTGATIITHMDGSICSQIVNLCNRQYVEHRKPKDRYGMVVATLMVPLEPMEKPASQIVTVNRKGEEVVADSPEYKRYIKRFVAWVKDTGQVIPEQPIDFPCQVIMRIYSGNTMSKSIPAYTEATLDCLVASGILQSKGHRIVRSIDGSRVFGDQKNPRLEIWIKERG